MGFNPSTNLLRECRLHSRDLFRNSLTQFFAHQEFRNAIGNKIRKLADFEIAVALVKLQCAAIERRNAKICVAGSGKGLFCELQHPPADSVASILLRYHDGRNVR